MAIRVPTSVVFFLLLASPGFGQRLPGNVTPEHYDIRVEPNLAAATVGGAVRIEVTLARPSAAIVLNAVRNQDTAPLVAALLRNRAAQALTWQLLQARWDDLQKKTGGFAGNAFIVGALSSFCDAGTFAEVKRFFAAHQVPEAERTLLQTTERINACSELAAAQSDKLVAWLRSR
jgi:ERAP1-like protein